MVVWLSISRTGEMNGRSAIVRSMRSNDHEVLAQALQWQRDGVRCALATVLGTYGASPRPPGAMAVFSERGLIVGSVSGGCVEDDLLQEVAGGQFWSGGPGVQLRTYGRDAAERERYRLPCGNALRVAVEAHWCPEVLAEAEASIAARRTLVRHVRYDNGRSWLTPHDGRAEFHDDAEGLSTVLGPRWRLLLIGATEVSRYLLPIARALGYAVTVCDPREEYTGAWPMAEDVPLLRDMPDDAVLAFGCDACTAVIATAHDPKLDDLALMEALRTPAFYVGALGSSITSSRRRERLRLFDLSEAQVAAFKGPVGLPIGSRSPAEIAVSIAGELVHLRRLLDQGLDPVQGGHLATVPGRPSGLASLVSPGA